MKLFFIIFLYLTIYAQSGNFVHPQNLNENIIEFCNEDEPSDRINCIETQSEYIRIENDQQIELFSLSKNRQIIFDKNENKSNNLKWYFHTIPSIARKTNRYQSSFINSNSNGFYIQLDLLNNELELIKSIKKVLDKENGLNLTESQIELIKPDQFRCFVDFACQENFKLKSELIYAPKEYPFRVEFFLYSNTKKSECFYEVLDKNESNLLNFECQSSILSSRTLKINGSQLETLLFNKLKSLNYVYLTQYQLNRLIYYFMLNLSQEFNLLSYSDFKYEFIENVLNKRNINFEWIEFSEVINSLSNYANIISIKTYLSLFYTKMSLLFRQSRVFAFIRVRDEILNELKTSYPFFTEIFSLENASNYVKRVSVFYYEDKTFIFNNIEWKFKDTKIIPVKINVLKFKKSDLVNKIIKFDSFKKEINSFYRKFNLNYSFSYEIDNLKREIKSKTNKIEILKYKCHSNKINFTILNNHNEPINSLIKIAPSSDFISCTNNNGILLWSEHGVLKENISNYLDLNGCTKIVALRYGFLACASSIYIKLIRIYNYSHNFEPKIERTIFTHSVNIKTLITLLDNYQFISFIDENHHIFVIDSKYGSIKSTINLSNINSIGSLSNGDLVVTFDDRIYLIDTLNGIEKTLSNIDDSDLVLELDDEVLVYTLKKSFDIVLFNQADVRKKAVLTGHFSKVKSLLKLLDGNLASGSDDGTIIIWNIKTNKMIQELKAHENSVISLEMLDNGNLVSGSTDGTIIIWDKNFNQVI